MLLLTYRINGLGLLMATIVLALASTLAMGQTGRARHERLFLTPASGSVVIDGSLDDWDFSAHLYVYVVKQTAESRHARFAMMYDEHALYIGAKVRDDSPMMNRHDPRASAASAWDGDACQVRMVLDPSQGYPVNDSSKVNVRPNNQMVHMLLWYYSDRQEPNLQLSYGMTYDAPKAGYANNVVPHDRFEAAYRKFDDGSGYSFEYRIPWSTLEARQPPKAGDLVAGHVQILWSNATGLHVDKQSGVIYDVMAQAGFPWQSASCWGKFIFSPQGNLPRALVDPPDETPAAPLPLEYSFQMPAGGEVSMALVNEQGMVVRQLLAQSPRGKGRVKERWDGLDDLGHPLPAGAYHLRGVTHQGIATRFVMSIHNSGQPPYKTDDNTGGWGGDHGHPTSACAVGKSMLLGWDECEAGWGTLRTDLTGKRQWGNMFGTIHVTSDGERGYSAGADGFRRHPSVRVFDLKDGRSLSFGHGKPFAELPPGADPRANHVAGLTNLDGKLYIALAARDMVVVSDARGGHVLATWPVPAPHALASRPDGSVLVISQGQVLLLRDGQTTSFIDHHLDDPHGLAVDAAGQVYVSNHGSLQNVSVFAADGSYQRSIGKLGGRPSIGRYDPTGMLQPAGIAVDAQGQLWVPEAADAPKRISVWNTQSGKLIRELFGGSAYSTFVWIDPQRPDEAYCHNVIWKIDLDQGTWRPHSTIWRKRSPNGVGAAASGGYVGRFRVITAGNGRQFGWGGVNYGNILYIRDDDIFKPIAGVINVTRTSRFVRHVPPVLLDLKKQFPDGYYHWQDANDDQEIQIEEVHGQTIRPGTASFNWIDADLNVWCDNGVMFKPVRFDGDRPIYDFDQATSTPFRGNNGGFTSTWIDTERQDGIYQLNPGHTIGFGKWTTDGDMIWGYRGVVRWQQAVNLPPLVPGKLWGPTMPLGVAGEFTGVATYFGPFQLFTRDGRFVAMVFRDLRLGGLYPDTLTAEAFAGQLVKTGERYFLLTGDQDGRVTEVLGLDQVKPLDGDTVRITSEDEQRVKTALTEMQAGQAATRTLAIGRGKASLANATRVGKTVGDRQFHVGVARDEQNLYFHFNVVSPNPLTNRADPRTVFKGGNVLDIQIAANPDADPQRKTPGPGDMRLLVTQQDGKPLAVLYRPKVADFSGEPTVLSSPTGSESFDAIDIVSDRIGIDVAPTATGFTALVTVPLELMGLTLKPGMTLALDLGYIFGNQTGSTAALRAYWSNAGFAAGIINDVPNESRLEPALWGAAFVE